MTELTPRLSQLATAHGVATEFWDWQGRHTPVSAESVLAVLGALGVDAGSEEAVERALADVEREPWTRVLPAVTVMTDEDETTVPLRVPQGTVFDAEVVLEDGTRRPLEAAPGKRETRRLDGTTVVRIDLELAAGLPLGWHAVEVRAGTDVRRMSLVVTPARIELPEGLQVPGAQSWGLMTQLYAMRSSESWGTGDLADLGDVGAWTAGLGADFVLVNPLHAAEPVGEMEPSPYLPTSRRFVNPIYLRVEDVPEVAYLSAAERQLVEWHSDDAKRYLDLDLLERDAVWRAKESALRLIFRQHRSLRRTRAFQAYVEREGRGLVDFATWCAIAQEHGTSWRSWPEELQDPTGAAVEAYRERHTEEVEIH